MGFLSDSVRMYGGGRVDAIDSSAASESNVLLCRTLFPLLKALAGSSALIRDRGTLTMPSARRHHRPIGQLTIQTATLNSRP